MPAHKRELARTRCVHPGCDKKATFEVYNTFNSPVGCYCSPHADSMVSRLNTPRRRRDERSC